MFKRYRDESGSWHIIATYTRVPGRALAWCSRVITGPEADEIPENEKSCEMCFRRKAKAEGA